MVTAGATASYVAGATPVALDAGLAVADAAAVSLSAAMVSISAGFVQGDTLSVGSPQTGIASQYNAATGVLTLSGAASLAAYEAELDSITYASVNATTSSRTILWSVNDGVNASAPVTSHVSVSSPIPTNPAPDLNILWQNIVSGQASFWDMTGNTRTGSGAISPNPGPSWRAVGTGAFFNGDTSDILWQNRSTGQAAIWEMDGDHPDRRRGRDTQSRTELESDRNWRLQRRWGLRHPVAERPTARPRSGKWTATPGSAAAP